MTPIEYTTTPEGTEYTPLGNRGVVPDHDHELGGGVDLSPAVRDAILASPTGGSHQQTEWTFTGRVAETRVGPSKVLRISQTHFRKTVRTVELTIVDVADIDYELTRTQELGSR